MRILRKTNIRVEVEPRREGDFGAFYLGGRGTPESNERHLLEEAQRIESEIRRHVDSISSVHVRFEFQTECQSGRIDAAGNSLNLWPECCGEDQTEFFTAHADEPDEWFFAHGMGDPDYLAEFRAEKAGE